MRITGSDQYPTMESVIYGKPAGGALREEAERLPDRQSHAEHQGRLDREHPQSARQPPCRDLRWRPAAYDPRSGGADRKAGQGGWGRLGGRNRGRLGG
jgi:hypothetical protein